MLRGYQFDIVKETRLLMQTGTQSILITAPTGSGKTCLTAHMLKTCAQKNMSAWFIVHRRELIKQSIMEFNLVGVPHGVVASGFLEAKRMSIQIASIQTLARRLNRYRAPSLIIFDEAHHIGAKSWDKIFKAYPKAFHIGLTATPMRLDGKGLGNWFQEIVHGPSVEWLIENEFLSPYRIFAPSHLNMGGIHTKMGDFVRSELDTLVDRPTITGDAIKHYKRLCMDKRAVVFCVSIKHSQHVVEQFNLAGIPAEHVDGETAHDKRDLAIEKFRAGDIKVLSNVDLFGEGFDLPAMEAVIMLRPTQSLGLYLQQCGRSLRYIKEKTAIILDHAGNCERHGLPDEDRNWRLDMTMPYDKKSEGENLSVRVCPKCFAAQRSGSPICSFCGFEFPVQSRKIEEKDGDLVEVDPEMLRRKRMQSQGMCKTLEELVQEGTRRGMKRPRLWAQYVFNARQQKKLQGV